MTPILIESIDDPRLEVFRDVRDRDAAGRLGVFIAEGDLVVRRLLAESPMRARAVLLSRARFAAMEPFLAEHARDAPVYVAAQDRLDALAGFHIHRGVLAAGDRPAPVELAGILRSASGAAPVVVLEDLTNHDNVGGIFRNASAFGAGAVVMTERCADPLYRKAIRVSIGATLTVPTARVRRAADAIDALHAHGFTTLALTPSADAIEIRDWVAMNRGSRVALLLGAEGPGLSDAALRAATARVRIGPMSGVGSLNVAVAAGIALHAVSAA